MTATELYERFGTIPVNAEEHSSLNELTKHIITLNIPNEEPVDASYSAGIDVAINANNSNTYVMYRY